jgi:type VI secretion system protein ImpC
VEVDTGTEAVEPAAPPGALARSNPDALLLAELASIAVRIEPQLLRRLRLELLPHADASAEADLWFSELVESRTPSGIVLSPAVARLLRERLKRRPTALESAWRIVESLHRDISPAVLTEERLTYLALAGKAEKMHELLRSAVATLLSPKRPGLAGWAARALERLPDEVRVAEEAQMLAFGASLRLGDPVAADGGIGPGPLPDWIPWLAPGEIETVTFGVALLEDAVELGPPGRARSHRIEIPKTSPIIVEVSWDDTPGRRTERVVLQPNATTLVETGPGVSYVELRTVLGELHQLIEHAPRRETTQDRLDRERPPRVSITYEVEAAGSLDMRELPFVVAVLADVRGHGGPRARLGDRRLLTIDRDTFDAVLASTDPGLSFTVEDRRRGDGTTMRIALRFRQLADFEPAAVARQIPALADLLAARKALVDLGALLDGRPALEDLLRPLLAERRGAPLEVPTEHLPGFKVAAAALASVAGEINASAGELVRRFVEQVELPADATVDSEAALRLRIASIDRELSVQLREVMHHPEFQALEATWRGIYFLVDSTETSARLKIRLLDVSKAELHADAASTAQNGDLFRLLSEEYLLLGGEPVGVMLGAQEFDAQSNDVGLLGHLSAVAAATNAPFIAAAGPRLFGMESFGELVNVRDIAKIFESPEYIRWRSFRDSEDARYLALTLPRVLLRLPYGPDSAPVEEFAFEELPEPDPQALLWGSAAFALVGRMTDAFARYGWVVAIRGPENGGLVEGLPSSTARSESGEFVPRSPTDVVITDRRELELANLGFIPLVAQRDGGSAVFFSANTVQKPHRQYESPEGTAAARLGAQLPYLMACCRFVHYMRCMSRDKIGAFKSREDVEAMMNRWIRQYVLLDDEADAATKARRPLREARIEVAADTDVPGSSRVTLFLRPHYQLPDVGAVLRVSFEIRAGAADSK